MALSTPGDSSRAPRLLLAPLWHTALIVFVLIGVSAMNVRTRHLTRPMHSHVAVYVVTLLWEWLLLALVYWGLRMRGTTLRQVLGYCQPGARAWWTDVCIALGFWCASLMMLGVAGSLLRIARLHPEDIRDVVSQLAPASPAELALWLALAVSAGICEELIFRGYLQQQFTALTQHAWLGIAIAAVCFGLAHGYEGISGMVLIALYGALFGVLAYSRGNLRPGMMAHAWHDAVSGIVLYFGSHLLHRIPH